MSAAMFSAAVFIVVAIVATTIFRCIVLRLTAAFDDQRIGFSGIGLLFIIGLLGVAFFVKADKTPEHLKTSPGA